MTHTDPKLNGAPESSDFPQSPEAISQKMWKLELETHIEGILDIGQFISELLETPEVDVNWNELTLHAQDIRQQIKLLTPGQPEVDNVLNHFNYSIHHRLLNYSGHLESAIGLRDDYELAYDILAGLQSELEKLKENLYKNITGFRLDLETVESSLQCKLPDYITLQFGYGWAEAKNHTQTMYILMDILVMTLGELTENAKNMYKERQPGYMLQKGDVVVSIDVIDKHALITVQDHAGGICTSMKDVMFDPGVTSRKNGSGRGMSEVLAGCGFMDAEFAYTPIPNGTAMTITIPLQDPIAEA